jgi:hypothetical protein
MIALISVLFALLALEVFAPGVGISAISVLAVVMTVWWRPRAAVASLVLLFALQELLVNCLVPFDPLLSGTVGMLDEIALFAAGLRAVVALARGDRSWFARKDWTFAIVFLACGAVSSVLQGSAIAPAALGFALSCKFFGFVLFAASVPWKDGDIERAITAAIWAMPVLLLTGFIGLLYPTEVIQYLRPGKTEDSLMRGGISYFMAPFPHPGVYGWAMAVGALAAITRLLRGGSGGAIVGLVAGVAGAILSFRRRPLVGLPVALLAVFLRLPARQRVRVLASSIAVAGLLAWFAGDVVHATVEDTMSSYLEEDAAENSARGLLVLGALELGTAEFPLGVGFGRFGTYPSVLFYSDIYDQLGLSQIYGFSSDSPNFIMDTYWPHILAEAGVLGLIAMALFMLRIWRRVRPLETAEGRLASLLLVEGLVESLAGPVFDTSLQSLVIAIPIGMALRAVHSGSPGRSPLTERGA